MIVPACRTLHKGVWICLDEKWAQIAKLAQEHTSPTTDPGGDKTPARTGMARCGDASPAYGTWQEYTAVAVVLYSNVVCCSTGCVRFERHLQYQSLTLMELIADSG